ncbi:hypothetical protein KIP88_07320 [Bradyrhizobium sp. SRL28]|uniref:hypothetical protein n=1 Tax=Bradyrhizobium sp. SRL28 TaxID=2836178 RepID=UPI001BDE29DC|nr:hypothetical protein [Bradyrhizobium sp. SRL28]MBT1510310.1 hypothetical protein [Bradyrhizobium sp. SRL28]
MDGYAVRSMCGRRCPSGIAAPFNGNEAAKAVRMQSIVSKDRQPAIVLAAVKGEALARRPDGSP